jgi:uncharacterized membrane protein YfcA
MYGEKILNAIVGLIVGIAGGLIGLGGAELRLPYLIGTLRLPPHDAVKVNLAVSLFTVAAAIPARLIALGQANISDYLPFVISIAVAAVVAAYLGAAWLKSISPLALSKIISIILLALGIGLLTEVYVGDSINGLLPTNEALRVIGGLIFGFAIGSISSVLGVAGGEVIIPTLLFGYGVAIKVAGSLSLMISLPTVLSGLARHAASGFFKDRNRFKILILPMGVGSANGAVIGGLLVGIAPAYAVKVGLGLLLMWSSWKVLNLTATSQNESV